jgi:hypothetical protein
VAVALNRQFSATIAGLVAIVVLAGCSGVASQFLIATATGSSFPSAATVSATDFSAVDGEHSATEPPAGLASAPGTSGAVTAAAPTRGTATPRPTVPPVTTSILPSQSTPKASLHDLIAASDRAGIRSWASPLSIAQVNTAVVALTESDRQSLANVVLDTDGNSGERAKLLTAMRTVLDNSRVGFYAEIWSYTTISLSGNGFEATCNQVWLTPASFDGLSALDARNVLMHESLHSFNCVNNGPDGALNEGGAIWIYKLAFPSSTDDGASFAEATYGTKLYYRDVWSPPQPDYPLGAMPANASQKVMSVYTWLSAGDPSKLPWNIPARLSSCFVTYWSSIERNVDFNTVWLPAEKAATQKMLADPSCRPAA